MSDDTLTLDDLLILLCEECSEVIQAATKCLRFGFEVDHGTGYGRPNLALAKEIGDLDAIMNKIMLRHMPADAVLAGQAASWTKIARAEKIKRAFGRTRGPSP